jgi:hypothetical protein
LVVELDNARDVAPFADRQQLLQIIPPRVEICQREVAGFIAGVDLIRRTGAVRRRWPVAIHVHCDGDNRIGNEVLQLWPRSPVDRAGREVKEQVEDARWLIAAE